ncbi:hypothetical protein N7491_004256 [Penicillium cf. griseofulvum]|nr:hypothetical protein N7491_004256 [Penicillium cf. griseofulvum]
MFKTSREKRLQSYNEYWCRLCQYFELFVRRRVNEDAYKQMRRFLEGPFPAECKIPRRTKDKNTLDIDVFYVLYRYHWYSYNLLLPGVAPVLCFYNTPPYPTTYPWANGNGLSRLKAIFQNLPDSVCYRDIEPFYLKDPQSKRDVLCAIIEFRNLKGRQEGADGAFLNTDLIPELIWRLRVPKHNSSLPLRWRPEVLNTPLLRRFGRTPYSYELHKSLTMTYDSSRQAFKELGRDVRFEDDIGHYNFRRWTANEVNRNFTSQERQRVLGQSGDAVFEKHYQSQFIGRDLQHVDLLRPPQEGVVRFAGSMLRKRDLCAPSELTDTHNRAIRQHPDILQL